MKRFLSFAKKTRGFSPGRSDSGSTLSPGYEIKEKDLGKLHKAAFAGDLNKVKQLSKKSDVNQLDRKQRTPLHLACANGHAEVAQFLVENKAEVNLCDTRHQSPLMQAVQCQQESCVTVLLEHSADPNLVDINGNSALHLTTLIPSISVAELLLEHEADVNCQNKDGCTPLMLAVTENHIEMTEFLLEEGADMNIKDTMGRTSLMIAASNGQISMVRLLLRYEADVGVKDSSGLSAEDYAVRNGHRACSHLIAELGTKKKSPSSPFHLSSSERKSVPVLQPSENEDNSLEECLSGDSKNGRGDSWRSSDEEEKPQKINLRNLMTASQKHKKNADLEKCWGETVRPRE
ncbi:ankyrin repeat domain-containing protein 26-like [Arapaima gigas]